MAKKRITLTDLRKLKPGEHLTGDGLRIDKLPGGDERYTVDKQYLGEAIHRILGTTLNDGLTVTKAYEWLEERMKLIREGRSNLPKGRKLPMRFNEATKEYLKRMEATGGKDLTTKTYRLRTLSDFLKDTPINGVKNLEEYTHHRTMQGAKPATVNLELRALSHFYTMAIQWGWVDHKPRFPMLKVDNKQDVYLNDEECERLLDAAAQEPDSDIYTFCAIGILAGMRLQEILSIRLEDIDTTRRIIFIPQAKGGRRDQTMPQILAEYLQGLKNNAPPGAVWLFPSSRSESGHRTSIRKIFRAVVKAAGLDPDKIVRHTLRHTAVTLWANSGVPQHHVQRLAGHKHASTTQRYFHSAAKELREGTDAMAERLGITLK